MKERKPRSKSIFHVMSIVVVALCFLAFTAPVQSAVGGGNDYPDSIDLSLRFPELDVADNGNGTQSLHMEGYPSAKGIGLPALPSRVFVMALPPGTQASQAVIVSED